MIATDLANHAGLIAATITLAGTVVVGASTVLAAVILSRNGTRRENEAIIHGNEEIHVLVNQRLTDALTEIQGLRSALGISDKAPVPEPKET